MGKGLIRKIGTKIILPLAIVGIVSGCQYEEESNIGKSKVFYDTRTGLFEFSNWDVKEKKEDGTVVKYQVKPNLWEYPKGFKIVDLIKLDVDGERYRSSDSLDNSVIKKGEEKVNFLIKRHYFVKDSTKQARGLKALE
jgi:hypothetical protein